MTGTLFPRLSRPDGREALRFGGRSVSYRELAGAAAALARRLPRQQNVVIWAEPSVETVVAVVACMSVGTAAVPLNPKAGSREIEHILADCRPGLLLAGSCAHVPTELVGLERLDVPLGGSGSLADATGPEQTAIVLYTSGTTGPPKGVQIPRRAIESNLDALAEVWGWTASDRLAHALPLFHVHGLVLGILGALRRGGSVEHVGAFSPERLAAAAERGATMVFMVPTMVRRVGIEAEQEGQIARAFARPRLLVSGSAALPLADHRRMAKLTGQRIIERYGMTETLINTSEALDAAHPPGYVGKPLPGVELRLVDDDGNPIEIRDDETLAEIEVRGSGLFTGYLNRETETREAFSDGWFRTGDLATRSSAGHVRIVGRRSTDLIKSGGFRIGAGEIEAALLEHPAVVDAAVAGRADDDLGERVAAWVVLAEGEVATGDQLAAHVASLLSPHKRPREVHFLDELPRNQIGKVLKNELG